MHKRVLIIQTTPYSENYSSRSLDAVFHYWEKENVAQIFSRNIIPTKGHCSEMYQITDARLLKRWLHKIKEPGVIYRYNELPDSGANQVIEDSAFQRIGTTHTPTIEILRRALWRKKYWCTKQLNDWLDTFKPECIFYNFSNHIFTQQIALYVANRYHIPIITAIGDDFYFAERKTISPTYHIFRMIFKKQTKRIFTREGSSAVYCSDKIRTKYDSSFALNGETVYFNSTVSRKPFSPINVDNPIVGYFGNIRLGRNHSLVDIASALRAINPSYKLEVYSGETDEKYYDMLQSHPNVFFGGKIPYSQVQARTAECDIVVVAESFSPKDICYTRYSLSTKAADSLASGSVVLAYGPEDAGVIGYLKSTAAAAVCTDPTKLRDTIRDLLKDPECQRKLYDEAKIVCDKNHTIESSSAKFVGLVDRLTGENAILSWKGEN